MKRAIGAVVLVLAVGGLAEGVRSMQERRAGAADAPVGPIAPAVVTGGGFLYVSGVNGLGAATPATNETITDQTRLLIERLRTTLEGAGSSLGQTVQVTVYLSQGSDFDAMNAVYRTAFADAPPTRTTVVAGLPDRVLVQMSAVAVPNGAEREVLLPAGWIKSPRPYSYAIRSGDLVFLSGLLSRRPSDDQFVSGTASVQVKTILDNATALLAAAGLNYEDVVAARVYLTDDSYFEAMNAEYRKYLPLEPPARATAIVGLVGNEAVAEITLIASTQGKTILGPNVSTSVPISTAVRAGRQVFLSGVLGNTDANVGDVAAQAREVFAKIARTLEASGLAPSDVVDNTVFTTDVWQIARVDAAYREFFPHTAPARTIVGAKLVQRPGLIEMMMTGWK